MPLIKSLFTTLYSRIDHVVNRIENHDAQGIDLHQAHEIDEIFDRWEIKISTSEMMTKEFDSMDVMEKTFLYESKHFL
jgi:hypothetical protein